MIKVFVEDSEVTRYLISMEKNEEFYEHRLIGNTPSTEFKIQLDNETGFFNGLLNKPFLFYQDNALVHTLYVYEKPEKMTHVLSLTLYDSLVKANMAYESQLDYEQGTTIQAQLNEIESLLGLSIDVSLVDESILNKQVYWIDTTLTIRTYLGFIAELCGANIFSLPNGTYKFVPLSKNSKYTLEDEDVESFETGEVYTCTRVVYDDGVVKFEQGDEEGQTLYLSSDNSYIDKQSDIDMIYTLLNGLTFTSIKNLKCVSIQSLQLGEMVHYTNRFTFMALKNRVIYYNALYDIQIMDGEMEGSKQDYVSEVNQNVKIKRLQTMIDQEHQQLSIVSSNIHSMNENIAKLELNDEAILLQVSESYVTKEEANDYVSSEQLSSAITQSATGLEISFEKTYAKASDLDTLATIQDLKQTQSLLENTVDLQEDKNIDYETQLETLKSMIRLEDGNILLGKSSSKIELRLTNNRIEFYQKGSSEPAYYIDGDTGYVTFNDASYANSLVIDKWQIKTSANHNLNIKWIGG